MTNDLLTRDQIEAFKGFVLRLARPSELLVQDYEYGEFCKELDGICNMALSARPIRFDPENSPEDGNYLIYLDKENAEGNRPYCCIWDSRSGWRFDLENLAGVRQENVTHFMPIPACPGEAKSEDGR